MTADDTRDDDEAVERAAEHAARSIAERQETTRRSAQAQATDGEESVALRDDAEQHRRASHEQEREADADARAADEE